MAKKTYYCFTCETEFKMLWSGEEPKYCPFCKTPIETEESYDEDEDDKELLI